MPDESCRLCGGVLNDCTQCAQCKEVISMICRNCGTRTPEQFHNSCMYHIESIQTDRVPNTGDGNYLAVVAIT
ncbi:MAG: hypothetical protein DWQ18_02735 [Crenarchaeota archaeon]|nr:MAG: hypothetical protein DWQ17_05795 [Thermoproteota archaeon]RDJ33848.1 MAG: hypothetical protein DWQ18_02735 [Thermoproteota archaeon]RDJ37042.1 MAG: hypothetical protein DWQ13_07885 [Thermoproteota archaeon]RDJ37423.1 MAG: hypothetical protein DWQ19_02950 [Thermoproteota archaeon]